MSMNSYRCLVLLCSSIFLGACSATREPLLSNVEQLTTPSMGFDKAGEAYFSPDMRQIIFQAAPTGREHYQMYVMSLTDRRPRMVSTGRGECTCG
jgi:Tol biopolymer transport system component